MKRERVFVEDVAAKNALCCRTIRSPVAYGRILGIDCPRMPASYILVLPQDIPGENFIDSKDLPVLAEEYTVYIGEPVALLLGPDPLALENYASRCTVRVEALPPALSLEARDLDVCRRIVVGNWEKAEADQIIEGHYSTGMQEHLYSDPHGAVAVPSKNGIVLHTASQWPHHVRRSVARVLACSEKNVIMAPALLGKTLDGKLWYPSLIACHAAIGASVSGKPVRLLLTRDEDFRFSPKRFEVEIEMRSALDKNRHITGMSIKARCGLGAYNVFGEEIIDRICLGAAGAYHYPNLDIETWGIKTNTPPRGPFCGLGLSQGFFAIERHISKIADVCRLDHIELRKSMLKSTGKRPLVQEKLLDMAAEMSAYRRKWAACELLKQKHREGKLAKNEFRRGIGIAIAYQGSGFLHENQTNPPSVELTLEQEGKLEIKTSMVFSGIEHIWQNVGSEILGLDPADVTVKSDNFNEIPDTGPDCLSRDVTVAARLVEKAALAIRRQRFRDPLPITVRRTYRPSLSKPWGEVTVDQNALASPGWAAAVVEVEADPVTLSPLVRGIWLAVDGGKILSEEGAFLSLKDAAVHALGWASMERVLYQDGAIPPGEMFRYVVPDSRSIPPITIEFLPGEGVSKGIEELPYSCIPAAYAQAVSQATDHCFEAIPLGANEIWEAEHKSEDTV